MVLLFRNDFCFCFKVSFFRILFSNGYDFYYLNINVLYFVVVIR